MRPIYSFIIPFLNEEQTLVDLFDAIAKTTRPILPENRSFEVLFIDDGSTDNSVANIESLVADNPEAKLIQLRGHFGKSAALAAGADHAQGDVVFTLDADLQDDPKEIPRFLQELERGFDVVSGYKKTRHDPWTKVVSSRIFNWLVRQITGVKLHDVNCGFKAYRAEVFQNIRLYGELHRFVPVLAKWNRFRISEIEIEHHQRRFGKSKFGFSRTYHGLTDLLTVFFLLKYDRKPSHFFAMFGGPLAFMGGIICFYLMAIKIAGEAIGHRPLLILGVLLMVIGVQVLATGVLAELIVHLSGVNPPYLIRRIVQKDLLNETTKEVES
jgi:glycosyltransferase involved in cell wall biosynthesis